MVVVGANVRAHFVKSSHHFKSMLFRVCFSIFQIMSKAINQHPISVSHICKILIYMCHTQFSYITLLKFFSFILFSSLQNHCQYVNFNCNSKQIISHRL